MYKFMKERNTKQTFIPRQVILGNQNKRPKEYTTVKVFPKNIKQSYGGGSMGFLCEPEDLSLHH